MNSSSALAEYCRGLCDGRAWGLLAWTDVQARYMRTALGPLWLTLSHALLVGGLAFAFSMIFHRPLNEYFVYLAAGITIWAYLASSLCEGPNIFIASKGLMNCYGLPASVHIFRFVSGQLITLAHHAVVYVAALFVAPSVIGWDMLWALPALLLLATCAVGWSTILACAGARFRDLAPAIAAVMQMMFLFTPIFWERTAISPDALWFVQYNPFYHLIEIVRDPLLGHPPDPINWMVCGGIAVTTLTFGLINYAQQRRTLSFWL